MIRLREAIENKKRQFELVFSSMQNEKLALAMVREMRRFLCRNDLFYLTCLIGNDKIKEYPEFYKPFCDEVSLMNWVIVKLGMHKPSDAMLTIDEISDNPEEDLKYLQRMYLCYRTFYKTTIITKAHSLQLLLNFPNIHICLAHNKQENSSDNLMTIKNYFLTTPIRTIFPEYVPNTKEWGNMSGFSVATRTDYSRSEENIEAAGVDSEITGRHYQVAKKNDLVTEKSVGTREQREKTISWDERFNVGLFDDPQIPLQDYEGTRYHFADMYSVKKNDPKIKLIELKILKDGNRDNLSESNISNPRRFTVEGVKSLMSNMWIFMCQMMLTPEDPARMQFKEDTIAYFDSIPKGGNAYLLVDPASKRKKRSDYTVMLVVLVAYVNDSIKYIIVDGIRDKLDPKQRIDTAIELASKWKIRESGWEEVGLGDDNFYLEEKRREKQLYFTVTPITTVQVAKEDRIRNILVPEYSSHKWLWPKKGTVVKHSVFDGKNYDLTEELEFEFTQFPFSEHDDLLDAQTFLSRLSIISPEKMNNERKDDTLTFGDYAKIRDERLAQFRRNPWESVKIGQYA